MKEDLVSQIIQLRSQIDEIDEAKLAYYIPHIIGLPELYTQVCEESNKKLALFTGLFANVLRIILEKYSSEYSVQILVISLCIYFFYLGLLEMNQESHERDEEEMRTFLEYLLKKLNSELDYEQLTKDDWQVLLSYLQREIDEED